MMPAKPIAAAAAAAAPSAEAKMVWGRPTWLLLHTLAHKVKDESFAKIRLDLLSLITRICIHLPCPVCANHASEYLRKINFDAIQTKKDLKDMLFQFHNSVNLQKSYPQFSYANLDAEYAQAVTTAVIQNFLVIFQQQQVSGMSVNTFSTSRAQQYIQTWFRQYIAHFE
jgi:hypothetical protein